MGEFLNKTKNSMKDWSIKQAESEKAKFWLSALSFAEASFFPIPPDFFLIAILLGNKGKRWFYYAMLTTLFSILGAILGYFIGLFFFQTVGQFLVNLYSLSDEMLLVGNYYSSNAFLSVFISAFTPIPYKIFTIAGGFFKINFLAFITASILGRGLRFFIVAYIFHYFGERLAKTIFKYFNIISLILGLILIFFIIYFNIL